MIAQAPCPPARKARRPCSCALPAAPERWRRRCPADVFHVSVFDFEVVPCPLKSLQSRPNLLQAPPRRRLPPRLPRRPRRPRRPQAKSPPPPRRHRPPRQSKPCPGKILPSKQKSLRQNPPTTCPKASPPAPANRPPLPETLHRKKPRPRLPPPLLLLRLRHQPSHPPPAGNPPPKKPPPPAAPAAATTAAAAATKTPPAKRDPKPKLASNQSADPGSTVVAPARSDDTDLSDVEADLEGEVEEVPEAAVAVEKVKPLRMKISKAKERALMKEFGLDETVLSEEDLARRRSRLKTLIKLGKTRGYLTHVEISDHLPDKLVDAETLEAVITTLNDLGVAVYEQTPDAEALIITDNAPT